MKGKVQTVCGLVEPSSLGRTLTHEHLYMDFGDIFLPAKPEDKPLEASDFTLANLGWIRQNPYSNKKNLQLNSTEVMAAVMREMEQFKKYGGGTIVENTSFGIKRNVNFMHDISMKHGVNIVAGAGYYLMVTQKKETLGLSVEDMANTITHELTTGCKDAPHIKCGFIGEIGCSFPLNEFERKSIQASGETQESLGCPVMIHPGRHPSAPEEIFRIYTESGGDVKKMVMGHLDRTFNDVEALSEFASLGTFCEYDLFGIETSHYQLETSTDMPSDAQRIQRIKHLVDNGFEDKILIAHDIHTVHRLEAYGGHGFCHILKNIVPKMLHRGISNEVVDKILISNPSDWLSFSK
ncbi:phosphotriesterase-related protein-like isoform X1 [Eriocheir sinensis]|uniref:phosphotriesterase-related protein-like isoform X1 n=1 Tax=Eriocheir sinensis TaxID=95602 RepID=UPI0021C8ACF5|nr:phosphotriesterase-related protein-like isoform X1 [Eriocheir sinensis]